VGKKLLVSLALLDNIEAANRAISSETAEPLGEGQLFRSPSATHTNE